MCYLRNRGRRADTACPARVVSGGLEGPRATAAPEAQRAENRLSAEFLPPVTDRRGRATLNSLALLARCARDLAVTRSTVERQ